MYEGAFFAAEHVDASVFIEATNRSLLQRGAGPAGRLSAIIMMCEGDHPTTLNGLELGIDDVFVVGAGGSFDAVLASNAIPAVIDVPLQADPLLGHQAERVSGSICKVADHRLAGHLRRLSYRTFHSYDACSLQAELAGAEAQMLMRSLLASRVSHSGWGRRSSLVFRDAFEFMSANAHRRCSVDDLASAVGVSRRTLEGAFDSLVGVSPARFWRRLRLNNVRRLLETGRWNVTDAAFTNGLGHLGRMSGDYCNLFGELPSATVQRSLS